MDSVKSSEPNIVISYLVEENKGEKKYNCSKCGNEFDSELSVATHTLAKHICEQQKKQKTTLREKEFDLLGREFALSVEKFKLSVEKFKLCVKKL